jgi:hypothetical protein
MALPEVLSLLCFFKSAAVILILGLVLSKLLFLLPELLTGMFFLIKFYLTKFTGPFLLADVWDCTFPVLLAADWDLLLTESALLPP